MENPLHQRYIERWSQTARDLGRHCTRGSQITVYLHPAKTGGSTIGIAMQKSERWSYLGMRPSYHPASHCDCGDPECTVKIIWENITVRPKSATASKDVFIKFDHERYDSVRWFRQALYDQGKKIDNIYMTYRPARDRLVSLFCDYWNQALSYNLDHHVSTIHSKKIREFYKNDAKHYIDENGRVDGRTWFKNFMIYGSILSFSIGDIFDNSVMNFRLALAAGEIKLINTRNIDNFLCQFTDGKNIERKRVSNKNRPQPVLAALSDAEDIIDEMAERDWAYDQVADEYFTMVKSGHKFKL